MTDYLTYFRRHQDEMLAFLVRLVEHESPTDEKAAVDRYGNVLGDAYRALGASATEYTSAIAVPPASSISAATASARSSTMSLHTTDAPRAASSSAYARPRPCPAPVTIATWSSKRIRAGTRRARRS